MLPHGFSIRAMGFYDPWGGHKKPLLSRQIAPPTEEGTEGVNNWVACQGVVSGRALSGGSGGPPTHTWCSPACHRVTQDPCHGPNGPMEGASGPPTGALVARSNCCPADPPCAPLDTPTAAHWQALFSPSVRPCIVRWCQLGRSRPHRIFHGHSTDCPSYTEGAQKGLTTG